MKVNINLIMKISILLLIIFTLFIVNENYTKIIKLGFVIIYITFFFMKKNIYSLYNKDFFILILLTVLNVLLCIMREQRGILDTLITYSFLLIACLEFYENKNYEKKYDKLLNVFSFTISILLLYFIVYNLKNGLGTNFNFYLPNGSDKNYNAVTMFIYFCFCFKRKDWFGTIVAFSCGVLLQSRIYYVAIIMMILLELILKNNLKINAIEKLKKCLFNIKEKGIFNVLLIMTIFTILLSYWIVKYVPVSSIQSYQSSFNDGSNAMRVRANLYAINKISKNPFFIFYGYGGAIKKELGVEDLATSKKYLGFRLVQPHNLVLNLFLRYGILLSLFYLYIIIKLISKYWNKENLSICIAYLMMNMFMHSLLSGIYLMFFMLTLSVNTCSKNKKYENEFYDKNCNNSINKYRN